MMALLWCAWAGMAWGQTLNARRTAMGGVLLPDGGPASDPINVAYRAVPVASGSSSVLPLPIGLLPLIQDPPVFDSKDPDFNVYKLANQLYNPPWNLQLVEPATPSSDIVVSLGRDYLALQLGDVANVFPEDGSRFGGVMHFPAFGLGVRNFFANVSGVTHVENDLELNTPLLAALKNGEAFRPNTQYALEDAAKGQAAAALQAGWAGALARAHSKDKTDRSGVYVGARAKLLRGLAYGDARNHVGFATGDTLFSNNPVALDYLGYTRTAMPADGGWGQGFDLGTVWIVRGFEIGVGANDVGSRINWKVEESVMQRDSVSGDVKSTTLAKGVAFTSEIPATYNITVARRFGGSLIAADAEKGIFDTTYHLGAEHWVGPVALRAGTSLDGQQQVQYGGGVGVKFGRLGADAGVATNSRNLSHERGVELCVGLALYH
jgi:hypothetical protein